MSLCLFKVHAVKLILYAFLAHRYCFLVVLPGLLIIFFILCDHPLSSFIPFTTFFRQDGNLCFSLRLLPLLKLFRLLLNIFYTVCDATLTFGKDSPVSLLDV